jgi:uncharacterized protein (DUF1697 family)
MGYDDVRTLLQSGNVVFTTADGADAAARAIEQQIDERLGLQIDVIVRTGRQLAKIVADDPFADVADDGAKQFVAFLSDKPDPAVLRRLEQQLGRDRLEARGREIHAWCPDGLRDSRMMRTLADKRFVPTATVRNWNTVTKLLEMVR